MTINLKFEGMQLTVEYSHSPAQIQTMTDPGYDEEFELVNVYTEHGDNVGPLFELSEELVARLEEAIAEAHGDEYRNEYPEYDSEY